MSGDAKSELPYLNSPGGEWPEARSFSRNMGKNPFLQQRFVQWLIGARGEAEWSHDMEAVAGIDALLKGIIQRHPQFLEPVIEDNLDSDLGSGLGDYVPEERTLDLLKVIGVIPETVTCHDEY